jgi:hypothetical protein
MFPEKYFSHPSKPLYHVGVKIPVFLKPDNNPKKSSPYKLHGLPAYKII